MSRLPLGTLCLVRDDTTKDDKEVPVHVMDPILSLSC